MVREEAQTFSVKELVLTHPKFLNKIQKMNNWVVEREAVMSLVKGISRKSARYCWSMKTMRVWKTKPTTFSGTRNSSHSRDTSIWPLVYTNRVTTKMQLRLSKKQSQFSRRMLSYTIISVSHISSWSSTTQQLNTGASALRSTQLINSYTTI